MSEVPKGVINGLLIAAELVLIEAQKRLPAPIVGSAKDRARIQLASALSSIEMAKYHVMSIEKE